MDCDANKWFSDHLCPVLFADLMVKLTEGTGPDGTVAQIGQIVINWVCMKAN